MTNYNFNTGQMNLNDQKLLKLIQELEKLLESAGNLFSKARNFFQERNDTSRSYNTSELYDELLEYGIMIEDKIFWESRQDYLKQIEMFLAGIIDGEEFSNQFGALYYKNLDIADLKKITLKTETDFQFTSKSIGFIDVISSLFSAIELFDSSLEDSESNINQFSENTLKDFVEKDILPKVRKYCDETLT